MHTAECVFVARRDWEEFDRDFEASKRAWVELCEWLEDRSDGRFVANKDVTSHVHEEMITPDNVAHYCRPRHEGMSPAYRVFLVRGAGAYAGAFDTYGMAILGDACIDEIAEVPRPTACNELVQGDEWQCSRGGQIGAILHELGHLYGLEDGEPGFMSHYKTWPSDVEIPERAWHLMFNQDEDAPVVEKELPWWRRLINLIVRPLGWLRGLMPG